MMSTILYPRFAHSTEERGISLTLQGDFAEEVILELGIEGCVSHMQDVVKA